ncbi:MAG TPA: hypothetical protein PKD88_04730 [Nitrosomonas sp.]|nr:hypothetical protein [Nitrosomonas sp.]HMW20298.1 hypothetical protein [Nitrosomonas sp.]HMW68494.1 hypothetical protein [Nitrosomonas sp.]HMY60507.1 hypothetical protein [Nitrosomonas sp.]HMY90278.1 hypothetical protein [Nitrosomonas sp.]
MSRKVIIGLTAILFLISLSVIPMVLADELSFNWLIVDCVIILTTYVALIYPEVFNAVKRSTKQFKMRYFA